jgi:predicted nucleic acid-binding protein
MDDLPMVVLDTNVLEAAMRSRRGASFALLSAVGRGRFEIAVSVPLVFEYEEVLMRPWDRDPTVVASLLDYICSMARRQPIFYLWRPFLPDPQDDLVLEVAVAANAAIVTHNRRHLLRATEIGIRVLSPAEFLEEIGGIP